MRRGEADVRLLVTALRGGEQHRARRHPHRSRARRPSGCRHRQRAAQPASRSHPRVARRDRRWQLQSRWEPLARTSRRRSRQPRRSARSLRFPLRRSTNGARARARLARAGAVGWAGLNGRRLGAADLAVGFEQLVDRPSTSPGRSAASCRSELRRDRLLAPLTRVLTRESVHPSSDGDRTPQREPPPCRL